MLLQLVAIFNLFFFKFFILHLYFILYQLFFIHENHFYCFILTFSNFNMATNIF